VKSVKSPVDDDTMVRCVHELFELQVARSPDRIALRDVVSSLSYADAERRANHLAHLLCESGAGPDVQVALYARRSAAMILGMLGILKAEAAYVPLDPSYPAGRVESIVLSAAPSILVTERGMPELARWGALGRACRVVYLDDHLAGERPEPPAGRRFGPVRCLDHRRALAPLPPA